MGRVLLILVFLVAIASAVSYFMTYRLDRGLAVESSSQSESTVDRIAAAPEAFSAVGTLVFYPNNVGPVPYLFYQDSKNRTVAKALAFVGGPPTGLSSWTGARISVTGTLDSEHVVVSRITYLSGP